MIGIDTHVLVRMLTGDDPRQLSLAQTFLRTHCGDTNPAWIGIITMIETVWVLESRYRFDRADIAHAFDRILQTEYVSLESEPLVKAALVDYRAGRDFSDALMSRCNRAAGCTTTITFDRHAAAGIDGFTLLAP